MSGNESEEVPSEIEKYIEAVETTPQSVENESEVPSEIEKYIEAVETAPQSVCLLRMDKSGQLTGKYFSEELILVSRNPKYDRRLLIVLRVQYMKISSSEHVVCTNCLLFLF